MTEPTLKTPVQPLNRPLLSLSGSLVVALAGLLAGCGGVQYTAFSPRSPEHFARHDVEQRFLDLHWTLERKEGQVVVRGIATASRIDAIQNVTLEVVGLDERGKMVSRAFGTTYGGRMSRWQRRPFSIHLRPTGGEVRFDVNVWHFSHELGNGSNGIPE
ncbi:MAG: hypothetical protein ACE5JN_01285 [Candidatus Methylomirabilia bacterium]